MIKTKRGNRWTALLGALAFIASGCAVEGVDSVDGAWGEEDVQTKTAELGSSEPVQLITTLAQLRAMTITGNYRLANNITMPAGAPSFQPIGSPFAPFRGTFDGNGFTINNLRIDSDSWYAGMFSSVNGAILRNVRLVNVNVRGGSYTGAIASMLSNTELSGSYVTGTVSGNAPVGMAIGQAGRYARISRSYATGTVTGNTNIIGGFIGEIYASGWDTLNDHPWAGVNEVYTNVNVNPTLPAGVVMAGGLVGKMEGGRLIDISTVGPVRGRTSVGGIVGQTINITPSTGPSLIHHALSRGNVTSAAGPNPAGPIGTSNGDFLRCIAFYDLSTDSGTPSNQNDTFCNRGWTSAELKQPRPNPNKLLYPFIRGQLVTQADINAGHYPQCKLASGSDGDWGFGTCGTSLVWALNSNTEHLTLLNIPNPSIQPK